MHTTMKTTALIEKGDAGALGHERTETNLNTKNAPFTRTAQLTQPKLLGKEDGKIVSSPDYSSNIEPMSQTT